MYFTNRIIVQAVFIFGAVICLYSGNPVNPTYDAEKNATKVRNDTSAASYSLPPHEFPSEVKVPYELMLYPNVTPPICWPNVSESFWIQNLYNSANVTKPRHRALRKDFKDLTDKFSDHLNGMIATAEKIKMLLNYNGPTLEEFLDSSTSPNMKNNLTDLPDSKKSNYSSSVTESRQDVKINTAVTETTTSNNRIIKDIPDDDSSNTSLTIPILLLVILMLVMYIAFLYRKLQFARFKDRQILIQDELTDPWASR